MNPAQPKTPTKRPRNQTRKTGNSRRDENGMRHQKNNSRRTRECHNGHQRRRRNRQKKTTATTLRFTPRTCCDVWHLANEQNHDSPNECTRVGNTPNKKNEQTNAHRRQENSQQQQQKRVLSPLPKKQKTKTKTTATTITPEHDSTVCGFGGKQGIHPNSPAAGCWESPRSRCGSRTAGSCPARGRRR